MRKLIEIDFVLEKMLPLRQIFLTEITMILSEQVSNIVRNNFIISVGDIQMSFISHGKQFINKVSFFKYINDKPKFGNELAFTMPLTTENFVIAINNFVLFCRYNIFNITLDEVRYY
jgi:hypothetical protein